VLNFFVRITLGQWPGRLEKPNAVLFLFTDENNEVIRHQAPFDFTQQVHVIDVKELQAKIYQVTAQAVFPAGISRQTDWGTLDLQHDIIHLPGNRARINEADSAAVDLPRLDAPTGNPSRSLSSIEFVSSRAEFFVRITIGQWPGRLAKPDGFVFLFTDENNVVIRREVAFNFRESKNVYDIRGLQGLTYTVTAQARYPDGLSQPTQWPTLDLHHDIIQFN